ncbi:hypothetical protein C8R46DRAFT_88986 [Mycena filopes]|nr:hypothetical protein C8R46DRAFT_88986 [Mycena filopes]
MPAGGRTPFTPQDDTLLSKYLAKYNPGIQGRSGNKIYQLLVENEHDKWPWSSRHPWQGWRDRYTKNQSQFNKRIKEYQVKKGLPTENTHWINGTQKLKGSDAEEEEGGASGRETDEDGKAKGRVKRKRKSVPNADARKRAKRDESDDEDHSGNDSEEYVWVLFHSFFARSHPHCAAHAPTSPTSTQTSQS